VNFLSKNLTVFLKEIRLKNNNERLSDMAAKLGVSASYLSTVETQKRRMNDKLFKKIIEVYHLDTADQRTLNELRNLASNELSISFEDLDISKKEAVVKFLSNVDDLSSEDLEKINLLLKSKKSS
jgi:transcriptional regulator with XRE-family HTH domain